ncbi:hypothetical protein KXS07_19430 [Inquilinus limosus]|uniref:hypothetical protein n=1 Tax=Inquilinus limosus TaxID=171674 RepID=UPI003F1654A2
MENEWTIKPGSGLGEIKFGMTLSEISSLNATYGELGPAVAGQHRVDATEDTIAQFGQFPSEEDIAAVRQAATAQSNIQTQTFLNDGPVLTFFRDRLVEITIPSRKNAVNYQDGLLYSMDCKDVLALFERANGAPGRYGSTGAAFDNISIYLDSFSFVQNGGVQPVPSTDRRFRERTIGLRDTPYSHDEMLPDFIAHSFL